MAKKRKKKRSKYGSMRDDVRRNAKESREAQSGGGTKFSIPSGVEPYEEKPGRATLRIIPYVVSTSRHPDSPAKEGRLWYKRPYWVHGGIGVDNAPRICLKSFGKPCPICEERSRLMRTNDADKDLVAELRPRYRILYNVMLPKSRKHDSGAVYLWDISYFNFQQLLDEEIEEGDETWAGFADIEGGFDLKVRFSEESFAGNKFAKVSRIDFVERDDLDEDVVDEAVDLDSVLTELPYKKLEAIFMETGDYDEVEDEEEEEEDFDEDEEEEDFDEDDDDEDEPEPPTRTKSTRRRGGSSTKKTTKKKSKKKNRCPSNHDFGTDCDEYDECEECDEWDDCFNAQQEMEED